MVVLLHMLYRCVASPTCPSDLLSCTHPQLVTSHPYTNTHKHTPHTYRGGRYQGHKKTEKFLPVGAIVTVVGELARNSISTGSGIHMFRCVWVLCYVWLIWMLF